MSALALKKEHPAGTGRSEKLSLKSFDCYRRPASRLPTGGWSRTAKENAAEAAYNPAFRKPICFRLATSPPFSRPSTGIAPRSDRWTLDADNSSAASDPTKPYAVLYCAREHPVPRGSVDIGTGYDVYDVAVPSRVASISRHSDGGGTACGRDSRKGFCELFKGSGWHFSLLCRRRAGRPYFPISAALISGQDARMTKAYLAPTSVSTIAPFLTSTCFSAGDPPRTEPSRPTAARGGGEGLAASASFVLGRDG